MLRDPSITQDSLLANSNSFYCRYLFLWDVLSLGTLACDNFPTPSSQIKGIEHP
ncbi:hypothetical protein OAU26_02155 [Mariniblastus sp.]|nr:hypothetical protein [Mariniblastus sp.]MDC3223715.1 hypothetical protein [Mariniblastus sp.]